VSSADESSRDRRADVLETSGCGWVNQRARDYHV
jgi:hypothetical protein